MNDAGDVQPKPYTTENSVDVLESLRGKVPDEIFDQLAERVALGVRKYGTRLQTFNGRDPLLDCLQECLDGIMYSQQCALQGLDSGLLRHLFTRLALMISRKRQV